MQGEQLKQLRVQLGACSIPLGRKFLVIREGERVFKLKARGGSRSIYSIEDQAVVSIGSTRSGRRHFRYPFPRFANGVRVMNDQQSKGDHVAVTEKNSSSGTSQRRKNFAKKSTSNNFRRTLQQAKPPSEKPSHQLLHKDVLTSSRRSRSRSPADVRQKPVVVLKASKGQTKDKPVSGEQTDSKQKDERTEKPLGTAVGHSGKHGEKGDGQKGAVITASEQPKQNGNTKDQVKGKESLSKYNSAAKDHVNNKENHPKVTKHSSRREEEEKRVSKDGSTMQEKDSRQQKETSGVSKDKDLTKNLKKSVQPGTEHNIPSSSRNTGAAKTNRVSRRELSSSETKRQRASTPTPESPVKKTSFGRLSRKRHRSASPKVVLRTDENATNASSSVKVTKESIIDSAKFGMVKKICKNAISQRKDSVQKGPPETHKAQSDNCEPDSKAVDDEGRDESSPTGGLEQKKRKNVPSPDHLASASKKQKLSSTKGLQSNGSSTPRSSDSEDALTKLMKDFQSATSSPHRKGSRHTSKESAVKSSRSSPKPPDKEPPAKTTQRTTGSTDSSVQCHRGMSELDALQTEAVSSDEEFESSPGVAEGKDTDTADLKKDSLQEAGDKTVHDYKKEKPPAPVDNFLVVDEIGYTPPKARSSPAKSVLSSATAMDNPTPKDDDALPQVGNGVAKSEVDAKREVRKEGTQLAARKEERDEQEKVHPALEQKEEKESVGREKVQSDPEQKVEMPVAPNNGTNGFVVSPEKLLAIKQEICTPMEQKSQDFGEQKSPHKEIEESVHIGKPKPSVVVSSAGVQTDHIVASKEQSCQTQEPRPDVKHQYVQFDSEPQEIDPEEITRIVSAMIESESEEKERMKKSLEESTQKEERWRNMVKDLCRQLRELRQQLEKKEDKLKKDSSTNTDIETSALPCIISTQASQTEYSKNTGTVRTVSVNRAKSSRSESPAEMTPRGSNTPSTSKVNNIVVVESNASPAPMQVPIKSQAINLKKAVPTAVPEKPAPTTVSPAAFLKAHIQPVQKKVSDEVIDLTEAEEPTPSLNKQIQQTVVFTRSLTGTVQNATILPSRGNTVKLVPAATLGGLLRPTQTQHHVPSSAQGVPKSVQSRVSQDAVAPVTSVNRTSTQGISQVVVSQSTASVPPPPLQPAPNVTVYKPPANPVPVLKQLGNFNMIFQNQAGQPRQDVLLAQQVIPQPQMIQAQGFGTRPQQPPQHVSNAVLRGVMAQYPGATNIIIPRSAQQQQQQQSVPVRMPQNQAKQQVPNQATPQQIALQYQKSTLERKKEQYSKEMQQSLQQQNTEQRNKLAIQIQAITTQIAQLDRLQQAQLSPSASTQGTRFVQQPTTYTSTNPPVGQVANPQQVRNAAQQHKQVPTVLASQPSGNSMRIVNGTWYPATSSKAPQNKVKQPLPASTNTRTSQHKHPAPLPILQSYNVAKGVLLPPPKIRITKSSEGVVLSWDITVAQEHPVVKKYFLYAYQVLNAPPNTSHWKRIGEVGALPPPMACTLNQFQPGSTYFLAICAVDVYERPGIFSETKEVVIT